MLAKIGVVQLRMAPKSLKITYFSDHKLRSHAGPLVVDLFLVNSGFASCVAGNRFNRIASLRGIVVQRSLSASIQDIVRVPTSISRPPYRRRALDASPTSLAMVTASNVVHVH